MHIVIIANANVWSPYPLLCPLPICLSHLPPNFFPTLHFVSAGLRAAKRSQPGQKSVVKTFSGQKAGGLEAAAWWALRHTPPPHPHYWQKCSRNIHETAGRVGTKQTFEAALLHRKDRGGERELQEFLGGGSRCSRQLPICFGTSALGFGKQVLQTAPILFRLYLSLKLWLAFQKPIILPLDSILWAG